MFFILQGTIEEYINIGKINENIIEKYKEKIITNDVILTFERLYRHILVYHEKEYQELKKYIKVIIENPDVIIEEKSKEDTLIYLKHIKEIDKKARIVIKLATDNDEKIYNKNSILTIMRLRDKTWEQTIKNKGRIIYAK